MVGLGKLSKITRDIHEVPVQAVPPDPGPLHVSRGGRGERSGVQGVTPESGSHPALGVY